MRAYVYNEKKELELQERPIPEIGEGDALIEVTLTAICGTDLRTYRHGSRHIDPPRTIGHELVGKIVEISGSVDGFAVGDRVHVAPAIGCGTCGYCERGDTNLCVDLRTIGFQYDGSFADYMRLPAEAFGQGNVTRIDSGTTDRDLVMAEPLACVINAQQFLNLEQASSVAIYGGGFIGCLHAELARAKGVDTVIVVDVDQKRIDAVRETLPYIRVINSQVQDLSAEIARLTDRMGSDASIVACSVGVAQAQALENTRGLGHVSLFGGLPGDSKGYIDSNLIHYKEISVHGVHASTPEQNREALQLLTDGKLNTKGFNQNLFPLSKIEDAFAAVDGQEILKALIKPGE